MVLSEGGRRSRNWTSISSVVAWPSTRHRHATKSLMSCMRHWWASLTGGPRVDTDNDDDDNEELETAADLEALLAEELLLLMM